MAMLAHATADRRLVDRIAGIGSRHSPSAHSSPRCDDLATPARGQAARKPGLCCALLEIARGLP
jgi:hypothetical protein